MSHAIILAIIAIVIFRGQGKRGMPLSPRIDGWQWKKEIPKSVTRERQFSLCIQLSVEVKKLCREGQTARYTRDQLPGTSKRENTRPVTFCCLHLSSNLRALLCSRDSLCLAMHYKYLTIHPSITLTWNSRSLARCWNRYTELMDQGMKY